MLLAQEGKKGSKAPKIEKKEPRQKPPKSQRPKWQNIIDDEEVDQKDSQYKTDYMNGPPSEKKAKKQNHPSNYKMTDSDKEPPESETPEDLQIIIKTDKHSKQR